MKIEYSDGARDMPENTNFHHFIIFNLREEVANVSVTTTPTLLTDPINNDILFYNVLEQDRNNLNRPLCNSFSLDFYRNPVYKAINEKLYSYIILDGRFVTTSNYHNIRVSITFEYLPADYFLLNLEKVNRELFQEMSL
jgi:hypothetical protein